MKQERAVPLWAAVGVPFLGIPLMVLLLAFTVAVERPPVTEPETTVDTEQLEVQKVDRTIEIDADCNSAALKRG